jgi:hypothetical protein
MNVNVDPSEEKAAFENASPAVKFRAALDASVAQLAPCVNRDWSVPAGTLDWSCTQTTEHVIDCVFSYALQLSSRTTQGLLPFGELRALPEASPEDLVIGLGAVGEMFASLLSAVPSEAEASDGLVVLFPDDWAARGAYEVLLHSHDILHGLGIAFDPPSAICAWVAESPKLWMLDRARVVEAIGEPWKGLLLGSGRSPLDAV